MSHHDISTGTAKPASQRKPCSREIISLLRQYISAFPRCCTVTCSSCIAQRTNAASLSCNVPKAVHELHRLLAHVPARRNRCMRCTRTRKETKACHRQRRHGNRMIDQVQKSSVNPTSPAIYQQCIAKSAKLRCQQRVQNLSQAGYMWEGGA